MLFKRIHLVLWFLLAMTAIACSRNNDTPEAAARVFMDRYFVELDQRAALDLTEGVARSKLEGEIRALEGESPSADAERPRIYYRQISRSDQADGLALRFRLTVMVRGDATIEPEVLLRLRSLDGGWRVSNFEMLPVASAAAEF